MRRSTILSALTVGLLVMGGSITKAQLNLSWEEIGPNNTGNHVRAMVVDNSGTAWAGSVGGGLWKSTDGGSSWTMVTGIEDNLAVSCIAADGNNIYVGTGETYYYKPESTWGGGGGLDITNPNGFLKYTNQPGEGVFVSNDGGATWTHNNGTWNNSSVRYNGDFISIQSIATKDGVTLIGSLKGLYRSTDANLGNVSLVAGPADFTDNPITDIDFGANGVVFAATKSKIYRSTDAGSTFTDITSSIPVGTQAPNNRVAGHRAAIAIAPSDANVVYVTGANDITGNCTGVWKSVDAGVTWISISPYESATFKPFQNKGLYAMFLGVPGNDPNRVYIGGTKMYTYSPSEGWTDAASHSYVPGFSTRYVPAPQFTIAFDPSKDSTFFVGGDHEITRTDNLGRTYSFKTKGFNAANLYAISAAPSYEILVSDRYNGISFKNNGQSGNSQQQFSNIYSASLSGGGIARWSTIKPDNFVVCKAEDRGLQRSLTKGATFEDFYGFPIDSVNPCWGANPDSMLIDRATTSVGGGGVYDRSTAPIMPFCFDEYIHPDSLGNDTSILNSPMYLFLATGNFVWVCQNPFGPIDSVPTWNRVSNDMITQNLSSGRKKYFTAITSSNDANHYTYVATNNGEVWRLKGAHHPESFCVDTDAVRIDGGSLPQRWITDIEVDPSNTNNVIVTFGAYAAGDDRVWITNDATVATPTWRSLQGNLQADLPVHSAAFHPDPSMKSILIGTEEGIYGTDDNYEGGSVSWTYESNGVGLVPVTDITYRRWYMNYSDPGNYSYSPDNTLFIATHGRGAFKSSTLVSRKDPVVIGEGISLKAVPNPAVNSTDITFDLPSASKVRIQAYGLDGRPVGLLTDGQYGAGQSKVTFDTHTLAAGVYLVKAEFSTSKGSYQSNIRVVVVK